MPQNHSGLGHFNDLHRCLGIRFIVPCFSITHHFISRLGFRFTRTQCDARINMVACLTALSCACICSFIRASNPSHAPAAVRRVLKRDNTEWSGTSSSSDNPRNRITCRFEFAMSSIDSSLKPPFQIPVSNSIRFVSKHYYNATSIFQGRCRAKVSIHF